MSRALNAATLRLLKSSEGFRSHPYWDAPGGKWTVGYGETDGVTSRGPVLSEPQAAALLEKRCERDYAPAVDAAAAAGHVKLNDNQRGACVSAAYNLGPGIFDSSHTIGQALRRGDLKGVAQAFGLYVHAANGAVLAGLVTRRAAERHLFESGGSGSVGPLPDHKPNSRKLSVGDIGSDVEHFQGELNNRLRDEGHSLISVDGQYGDQTEKAKHIVTYVLGFPESVVHREGATPKVQAYIDTPSSRPKSYLATAKKRAEAEPRPDPHPDRQIADLHGLELLEKLAHVAEKKFGLTVWQWKPGHVGSHAANSYHNQTFPGTNIGRAFDAYGARQGEFARYIAEHAPQVTEGIYNPYLSIKDGRRVSASFWGSVTWHAHTTHVHVAV